METVRKGTESMDVSKEQVEILLARALVYRCGGCNDLHLSEWADWQKVRTALKAN